MAYPKWITIDGYIFRFIREDRGGFPIYRNRWGDETVADDYDISRGTDNFEDLKGEDGEATILKKGA